MTPEETLEKCGRYDAYYYSFDETGCEPVDRILRAVGAAGKAYHHTEDWNEPIARGEGDCVGLIQYAANTAAQATQWQPIETAPDKGEFLAYWPRYEGKGATYGAHSTTSWTAKDGRLVQVAHVYDPFIESDWKPTHWMPLPTPPEGDNHG